MSELSHDAVDDGFHEIQLSGKQLVFLFMATTVVSVVIFLCGVLVGRGVHIERPAGAVQAAAVPDTAQPSSSQPASSQPGSVPPPPSDAPPVAQATTAAPAPQATATPSEAPAPPAGDELTYPQRLEGKGAPAEEKLKPADASKAVDTQKAAARAAISKPSVPPPDAAPTTGGARPGTWVVQIAALRDRATATSIVQRLSGRGYPAYIVNPSAGAPTAVYRVQVGRYEDRREAEQVARRLEKEEKFNPWISR